ncbi:MAG: hypothetical protein HY815_34120 [Candidatus Riflebacteria bacterium]|nr:hypothetical protein [Candidatus Riflebacteria bacterium]
MSRRRRDRTGRASGVTGMDLAVVAVFASGALASLVAPLPAAAGAPDVRQAMERLRESRNKPADTPATVTATDESYQVGAQFRAALKKTFRALGTGQLKCATLGQDRFSVRLAAKVQHPDKPETIEFDVYREFRLTGTTVVKTLEKDWMNATAAQYKKRLIDTVALAYLVKWKTPRRDDASPAPLSFIVDGQLFNVSFNPTERWLEATLVGPDGPLGKFFLMPPREGVRPVKKFRIFAKNDLVVSFAPPETPTERTSP